MRVSLQLLSFVSCIMMFEFSGAILERCINGFECSKTWMKCTNLEYVGSPKQYDYSLPALMGFACLPHYEEDLF